VEIRLGAKLAGEILARENFGTLLAATEREVGLLGPALRGHTQKKQKCGSKVLHVTNLSMVPRCYN